MIAKRLILSARGEDPFENLALEEYLLRNAPRDAAVLYLWSNEKTVVIGRNQDAFSECDVAALEGSGGHLARRSSGGGAVFQDRENLNFTFIVPAADYDVQRQLSVVLRAVRSFGIDAEATGRNDLTVDGRKFSGNAFRRTGERDSHHGTLMIGVDTGRMSEYLRPAPEKLKAKGVASVRSRVVNLSDLCPQVTPDTLKPRLYAAFEEEYGPIEEYPANALDWEKVSQLREKYASELWRFGRRFPEGGRSFRRRFEWGLVELRVVTEMGRITDCAVYSDALEEEFFAGIPSRLQGKEWSYETLSHAFGEEGRIGEDLRGWLAEIWPGSKREG